jgi:hypothetical protein
MPTIGRIGVTGRVAAERCYRWHADLPVIKSRSCTPMCRRKHSGVPLIQRSASGDRVRPVAGGAVALVFVSLCGDRRAARSPGGDCAAERRAAVVRVQWCAFGERPSEMETEINMSQPSWANARKWALVVALAALTATWGAGAAIDAVPVFHIAKSRSMSRCSGTTSRTGRSPCWSRGSTR